MKMYIKPDEIISFWFETSPSKCDIAQKEVLWWGQLPENDQIIKKKYGYLFNPECHDREYYYRKWLRSANGCLALILIEDQFPRHIFRNTPLAYSYDKTAIKLSYYGLSHGYDKLLHPIQRIFFYLPLEHSENLQDQETSVVMYRKLYMENLSTEFENKLLDALNSAISHQEIIRNFGRFPLRNGVLKRKSILKERNSFNQNIHY